MRTLPPAESAPLALTALVSLWVALAPTAARADAVPENATSNACVSAKLGVADARKAIEFVATTAAAGHVGGQLTDALTLQGLRTLGASTRGPVDAAALVASINRELALAGDAHLRVELPEAAAATCRFLPLQLEWSEQGLLVTSSAGPVPKGARILSLGRSSLAALEMAALATIPHENVYWARAEFARNVVREDWIASLGLAAADGTVEVVFEPAAGGSARAVVSLTHRTTTDRPPVGFALYEQDSTAWFWMDRCEPDEDFLRTLDAFVVAVRHGKVRKVAIDLRHNPGGDVSAPLAVLRAFGLELKRGFGVDVRVSKPLLASMPMFAPEAIAPAFAAVGVPAPATNADHYSIPPPLVLGMVMSRLGDRPFETASGVELFLLTSGSTFSSASLFTSLVRDNALGRIVGEPNGNSASFNGSEVLLPVPGLPHDLHLSTARLERPDALAGAAPAVLPDVLASPGARSLRDGIDPALDYVRRLPVASR